MTKISRQFSNIALVNIHFRTKINSHVPTWLTILNKDINFVLFIVTVGHKQ